MDKLTETLLYIAAFVALSAVSNWFKKRGQKAETPAGSSREEPRPAVAPPRIPAPGQPTPPSRTQPPPKRFDWEEELRRMLEGESEEPESHPRPSPPPPPVTQPLPPPPGAPRPVRSPVPLPSPPVAKPQPAPAHHTVSARKQHPHLASLDESAKAYHRAEELHKQVAETLEKVIELKPYSPMPQLAYPQSLDAHQARALLRHHGTLRQSLIVSVVLGPPKSIEDSGPHFF